MEKRNCFGSREYSKGSGICTGCPDYLECGEEREKELKKRKLELSKGKIHDKK